MKLDFIKGTYTINADGSYDVIGDVVLSKRGLTKLPIRFNKVSGCFDCFKNNLTSLEGFPKEVGGYLCCSNNQLTSLEFCPKEVGGDFDCNNNKLTSLEGCPKEVGGFLDCNDNKLYYFIGIGRIDGDIYCTENPVSEIFQLCPTKEFIGYLNEFTPIRGKNILGKRLQDCLYMCDIEDIDVTKIGFENYTLLE